jgi:hypothetical protein
VFYIQKGKVVITVVQSRARKPSSQYWGRTNLQGRITAVALSDRNGMADSEIMRLEKATMIRVLHEEPAFLEMFVSHPLRTIRAEATWSTNCSIQAMLGVGPPASREFWEGRRTRTDPRENQPRDTRRVIGTTRSRVSAFMNKFRELGLPTTTAA